MIVAVLAAALCHAGWNAAAKSAGGGDPFVATSAIAIGGAVVGLPLLLVSGLPAAASYPHLVASGIVHVAYFLLVGLSYRTSHFSAVYPVTRGSAPLMTAVLAGVLLGEGMPPAAWLGVVLLSLGVLALGADALRGGGLDAQSLSLAAVNVAVIVGYTLLDGAGTRASANLAGYVLAMMALTGLLLLGVLMLWQGRSIVAQMLPHWRVALAGGTMVSLSYGTALWAMTKAPIGMVAALRETSVLFAAAIGALILKERFGPARWAATALILAGLANLRLG